jgi:hypothetical protein
VDCSDHEVNIKILLGGAVADGVLTLTDRELLMAMTDEVSALVLRDHDQVVTSAREPGAASAILGAPPDDRRDGTARPADRALEDLSEGDLDAGGVGRDSRRRSWPYCAYTRSRGAADHRVDCAG